MSLHRWIDGFIIAVWIMAMAALAFVLYLLGRVVFHYT
jgi:hypothetical protein